MARELLSAPFELPGPSFEIVLADINRGPESFTLGVIVDTERFYVVTEVFDVTPLLGKLMGAVEAMAHWVRESSEHGGNHNAQFNIATQLY